MSLEAHLAAIDEEMRGQLRAETAELGPFYEMMRYHLGLDPGAEGGGKRLRPLICLLLHEALGGDARHALPAAAAIELLHNFTLIHDDIEDQDRTRRHRPTVWAVWGVPHAINAGDGMYALSRVAVQRLRETGLDAERVLEAIAVLDRVCVRVCEGQFLDITFETRIDVSEPRYRDMVARKTGVLFRAAAELPGILAGADGSTRAALRTFGDHFGAAFQAHDDLQGVWGASRQTGKVEMNDIAKRKMTLPIVLAIARASPEQTVALARAYERSAPLAEPEVRQVRELLDALGMRGEVESFIGSERRKALTALESLALREPAGGQLARLVAEATGDAR